MMMMPSARNLSLSLSTLLALAACQPEENRPIQLGDGPDPVPTSMEAPSDGPVPAEAPIGAGDNTGSDQPAPPILTATPAEPAATTPMDAGKVETVVMQNCASTEVSAVDTTVILPADIIFAVDTSGSMGQEADFVQTYLNQFSQQIIASGVDARVILLSTTSSEGGTNEPAPMPDPMGDVDAGPAPAPVGGGFGGNPGGGGFGGGFQQFGICVAPPLGSGNCPDDTNLPNYVHVDQAVGSNDALNVFIDSYSRWSANLRPEAVKFFVVVSDDDATDPPNNAAATFTSNLQNLDPEMFANWSMNGVYSFTQCEASAAIGNVFHDLVNQTMGVAGDLCLQDFQPVFTRLAEQIVANAGAEILCEWEIPQAVAGQSFSTELVDVERTSAGVATALNRVNSVNDCVAGAWYFDDRHNPTTITACPQTCEAMQNDAEGQIKVQFACETVAGCAASAEADLGDGAPTTGPSDAGGVPTDVACEWDLPEPEDGKTELDLENVNVRYTTANGFGVLMGAVTGADACAAADLGWYYDNPEEPTKIVACPETCGVLTTHGITDVQALFGCQTKPAIPRDVL